MVSTFETSQEGVDYVLLVATYLDSSFLTSVADVHSLDLRLYLANPSGFLGNFRDPTLQGAPLAHPEKRRSRAAQHQAAQRTVHQQISGLYWPIFNDSGELQGVIFSGLLRHTSLVGW